MSFLPAFLQCESSSRFPAVDLFRPKQVEAEDSLAHLTQAEAKALNEFDAAIRRIEDYMKRVSEVEAAQSASKKQRVIELAKLAKAAYIETLDEVNAFLDTLRQELEHAIEQHERVQIR